LPGRSLPYAEIYGLQPHHLSSQALDVDVKVARTTAAGPIPRSWAAAATAPTIKVAEGPAWRATALSLFFAQSSDDNDHPRPRPRPRPHSHPPLPNLAECCLRVLLEHCAGTDGETESEASFLEQLAPYLAPHHRRLAIRLCAVRGPLSLAGLRALWGWEKGEVGGWNHVEGELVVVEPTWLVRPELFRDAQVHHTQVEHGQEGNPGRVSGSETFGEWDVAESGWQEQEQEEEEERPLTAVAIVSATLSIPALLALPPSLTRLALVHLSAPIPVHRLPDKCPLLEFLDLSFNSWLAEPAWGGERALERVAWGRWAYLKVLACRDCGVTSEELRRVNEGRWEDVTIVT